MSEYCLDKNVFETSLDRIRMIYDNFDEVVVSMSGGKDSTIVYQLALIVAKEKGRLPLKVYWLDQECEWQATVDYMNDIMRSPDVSPCWYQVPLDFTNSTNHKDNFFRIWDENEREKWCHAQSDISIKENPTKENRFHPFMKKIRKYLFDENTKNGCVLCGIRAEESPARKMLVGYNKSQGWLLKKKDGESSTYAYPIWDWTFDDVWIAIAKNKWPYNKVYDYMYQHGVGRSRIRVSALIHETAWRHLDSLQEFEPKNYDKFVKRIPGVSTTTHMFDQNCELLPKELPYMFKDWKEYRDYLLVHLVKEEYHAIFKNRWKNQHDEDWYKIHCKEVIINDIDGTTNHNHAVAPRKQKRKGEQK